MAGVLLTLLAAQRRPTQGAGVPGPTQGGRAPQADSLEPGGDRVKLKLYVKLSIPGLSPSSDFMEGHRKVKR